MTEKQVLQVMVDVCLGVKHMHDKQIAHRDLKVENILFQNNKYKLADFGSSSTEKIDYQSSTKSEISKAIERFEKYTTLMYRPPEMIDQYLSYNVDLQVDIWMLGCVLYILCFAKHPFQEAQKLAIINGHYFMPNEEDYEHISEKMRDLIRLLLTPNPNKRPNITELLKILQNYDKLTQIQLSDDAQEIKQKQEQMQKQRQKEPQPQYKKQEKQEDFLNISNQQQQIQPITTNESNSWIHEIDFHATTNNKNQNNNQQEGDKDWGHDWTNGIHNNDNPSSQQQNNPPVSHNPFDQVEFEFQDTKKKQSHNPFDYEEDLSQNNQDNQSQSTDTNNQQQNWFFQNQQPDDRLHEEEDHPEDHKNSWTQFDFNGQNEESKEQSKNEHNDEDLEDVDDEEGQPNMFQQINQHKNQRGRRPKRTPIAKSWCSSLSSSGKSQQQNEIGHRGTHNICTKTSDLITKFREFLQKS